jgi:hypothetical protein
MGWGGLFQYRTPSYESQFKSFKSRQIEVPSKNSIMKITTFATQANLPKSNNPNSSVIRPSYWIETTRSPRQHNATMPHSRHPV